MILIRSVKNRLALVYGSLFAGMFLLAFFLVYRDLSNHLVNIADSQIIERARRADWYANDVPTSKIQHSIAYNLRAEGSKKVCYILYSPEIEVLAQSDMTHWVGLEIDEERINQISQSVRVAPKELHSRFPEMKIRKTGRKGSADVIFLESGQINGRPYRIGYIRFNAGRVLVCVQSLSSNQWFLSRLRQTFYTIFAIALIASGALGYFLSARAMSGVNRVTTTARNIAQGNMDQRVDVGNAGIEIETLAKTFNSMLDKIQTLLVGLKQVSDDIAHDLRTPVTRIRSAAELMATQSADKNCRNQMGAIVEECDGLVKMINTMLEIAQTDSGIRTFHKESVDISDIVSSGFDLFHAMAEDKSIAYTLSIPSDSCTVEGNKSRLQRVVSNLLDNAIKFTPEKGKVHVALSRENKHVCISVSDTGPGIAADEQERIFDRFYRKDPSRNVSGNGLGLCLARSIARAHDGDLTLQSVQGKGSCFSVTLPIA